MIAPTDFAKGSNARASVNLNLHVNVLGGIGAAGAKNEVLGVKYYGNSCFGKVP